MTLTPINGTKILENYDKIKDGIEKDVPLKRGLMHGAMFMDNGTRLPVSLNTILDSLAGHFARQMRQMKVLVDEIAEALGKEYENGVVVISFSDANEFCFFVISAFNDKSCLIFDEGEGKPGRFKGMCRDGADYPRARGDSSAALLPSRLSASLPLRGRWHAA